MRVRRVLGIFLAFVLVFSMAACGNSETSPKQASGGSGSVRTEASKAGETTAGAGDASENGASNTGESTMDMMETVDKSGNSADEEDTAEIEIMFWTLNTVPSDLKTVEAAINAITEEKINTTIHLNIIEMGNYIQQVNLMMSGSEKLDLVVTLPGGSAHFNSMSAQNQLLDIKGLLEEYAQDLLKVVPESWLSATTIDGKTFAVTSYGDKATPLYFSCRTDILEKTGIDAGSVKTADDLEKLFAKVREVEPGIVPVAADNKKLLTAPYMIDAQGNFIKYDGLGDGDNCLVGIMDSDGTTIKNNYLRQEYLDTSLRFKKWYDNGWVYKDSANYGETGDQLIKAGTAFGYFKQLAMDSETNQKTACGHEMTLIQLEDDPMLNTGAFRKFTWAVPSISTEPEAAVKFLNLIYTDPEVLNLLMWGIEGTHYQTLADGTIDFLEGQNPSNCGYYIGDETSILGNGFLAKVRSGQAADLRSRCEAANLSANVSKFNGFSFNTEGFENQVAGITNTIEEYRPSFASGLYTEKYYNEFIQKLKDNGVEEYLAYIQKQMDAWVLENHD